MKRSPFARVQRVLPTVVLLPLGLFASGCAAQPEPSEEASGTPALAETAADDLQGAVDGLTEGQGELEEDLIPAGGRRVDGRIAFAGQPSEAELRALADAGVRVLDLRRPEEGRGFDQAALAQEVDLVYTNVPVDAPALGDPEVHRAFKEAIEADGELVVHCASGNRVAGLYYAYLVMEQGMDRDEAKARAKELGMTSAGVENGTDAYLDSLVAPRGE